MEQTLTQNTPSREGDSLSQFQTKVKIRPTSNYNILIQNQQPRTQFQTEASPMSRRKIYHVKRKVKGFAAAAKAAVEQASEVFVHDSVIGSPKASETGGLTLPSIGNTFSTESRAVAYMRNSLGKNDVVDMLPPTGLDVNQTNLKYLSVRYDIRGKPVKRSVVGGQDVFAGTKRKRDGKREDLKKLSVTKRESLLKGQIVLPRQPSKFNLVSKRESSNASLCLSSSMRGRKSPLGSKTSKYSTTKRVVRPQIITQQSKVQIKSKSPLNKSGTILQITSDNEIDGTSTNSNILNSNDQISSNDDYEKYENDDRLKKAYQRHVSNVQYWQQNIDRIQELKNVKHVKDFRPIFKSQSPSRTLLEMQKYFEDSVLREDEQNLMRTTKQGQDLMQRQNSYLSFESDKSPPYLIQPDSIINENLITQQSLQKINLNTNIESQEKTLKYANKELFGNSFDRSQNSRMVEHIGSLTFLGSQTSKQSMNFNRHSRINLIKSLSPREQRDYHFSKNHSWRHNEEKFYTGLRNGDTNHVSTQPKNSFNTVFTTEPTRRLQRKFRDNFNHLTKRSGFNQQIDRPVDPNSPNLGLRNGIIDPYQNSLVKLSQTLRNPKQQKKEMQMKLQQNREKDFVNQFNEIYQNKKNFKLKDYAIYQNKSLNEVMLKNISSANIIDAKEKS